MRRRWGSVPERRDTLAIGTLLVAFLALAVLLRPHADEANLHDVRATTYRSTPAGTRALFLLLDELALPVERAVEPFSERAPVGALVLLSPAELVTPRQEQAIMTWVRAGGTLIYAASGAEDGLRDVIGATLEELAVPDSVRGLGQQRWAGATAYAEPHAWTAGIDSVRGFRRAFAEDARLLRADSATVLLRAATGAPVVVVFRRGSGRVLAWSDVNALRNQLLRQSGAAQLFVRAAAAAVAGGGTVCFDEYHQGYRDVGVWAAMRRFFSRTGFGRGVVQVVVACLALLLLAGRRFGSPLRETSQRRRSPLEHVEAVAEAYRRAGALRTTRQLLLTGLERRLGRRVLDADGALPLTALNPTPGAQRLHEEWQRGTAGNLVALAAAIDEYAGEVRWRQPR